MRMFMITEMQAQDLEETLKSDSIRPRDLLRCLTTLKTLPQLNSQPEQPAEQPENEQKSIPGKSIPKDKK